MSLARKIAVTGARGMLGTAILNRFSDDFNIFATSRTKGLCKNNIHWKLFDLLDSEKLTAWLIKNKPDVVIHCAAMVNVDECEKEVKRAEALHVNTTKLITETISAWNARLVYISTDAVFDGKKIGFYAEIDKPCPLSIYGRTKYQGEVATLNASENNLVLRTTIFGNQKISGRISFADWLLDSLQNQKRLTLFTDVEFTPIHVSHFSDILFRILTCRTEVKGLFHLSGSTKLSKYDFGLQLAQQLNLPTSHILQSTLEQANLLALRGKNMTLSNEKLSLLMNIKFPTARDGIMCLK
ncbi:MAG: SDR family oxidoreductase [Gammaproteobacteria bacterium]|nr:SDR family oxidoreductase [Gammaproteobacteria bacterium]